MTQPLKVGVREFRSGLSGFIDKARTGQETVVVSRGFPVARLVAPAREGRPMPTKDGKRPLGLLRGKISLPDDFDDPLPDMLEAIEADIFPPDPGDRDPLP